MSEQLRAAAERLLQGARAYRDGRYNQQLDLQNVADSYLELDELVEIHLGTERNSNPDNLPKLSESEKQKLDECDLAFEMGLPQDGVPCELWRVVSIRTHGRHSQRFSEWFAFEDKVTAAVSYIKATGYELVSVTKYRQVKE